MSLISDMSDTSDMSEPIVNTSFASPFIVCHSGTLCLHTGQELFLLYHVEIHFEWKIWLHINLHDKSGFSL